MNRETLLKVARAKKELNKRGARRTFWAFCLYMDRDFFLRRETHSKRVAEAFQRVYEAYKRGDTYKLSVRMPPRANKSYLTTLFSVWMLGQFPRESVMRNCCSGSLYDKFSYHARAFIRSKKYQEIFPDVKLKADKQNIASWNLEQSVQCAYFGAGVEGRIIGDGASMLAITDDLFSGFEEAFSDTIREKTWRWKEGSHDSRYEKNCCSIDIGTRWSVKDVLGRLEDRGYYDEVIEISALLNEGTPDEVTFCNDLHTTKYYQDIRNVVDVLIWKAEYQQKPIEAEGLLFPKAELEFFVMSDLVKKKPAGRIGATDVADKGTDDFSSPYAEIHGEKYFITDVIFTKDAVEVTEARLAQQIIDKGTQYQVIESNNGGRIFALGVGKILKEMDKTDCEIEPKHTSVQKETRILMRSGFIKKNFVFRSDYDNGSDYARFMDGMLSYSKLGKNKHDDAPDSVTILAEYIEYLGLNKVEEVEEVGGFFT